MNMKMHLLFPLPDTGSEPISRPGSEFLALVQRVHQGVKSLGITGCRELMSDVQDLSICESNRIFLRLGATFSHFAVGTCDIYAYVYHES